VNLSFYRSCAGFIGVALIVLLSGCSGEPSGIDALNTRVVTLPDGTRVVCEVMIRPEDMARGMMHREQLAPRRGLLFVHSQPGAYPYWMHNVRVPLDIIWISPSRQITEISAETPSCLKGPDDCPSYGGRTVAQYVLEMAGGSAKVHGLKAGDTVSW
jgi:uncharacterized membrane protein (UPF0127 family)